MPEPESEERHVRPFAEWLLDALRREARGHSVRARRQSLTGRPWHLYEHVEGCAPVLVAGYDDEGTARHIAALRTRSFESKVRAAAKFGRPAPPRTTYEVRRRPRVLFSRLWGTLL